MEEAKLYQPVEGTYKKDDSLNTGTVDVLVVENNTAKVERVSFEGTGVGELIKGFRWLINKAEENIGSPFLKERLEGERATMGSVAVGHALEEEIITGGKEKFREAVGAAALDLGEIKKGIEKGKLASPASSLEAAWGLVVNAPSGIISDLPLYLELNKAMEAANAALVGTKFSRDTARGIVREQVQILIDRVTAGDIMVGLPGEQDSPLVRYGGLEFKGVKLPVPESPEGASIARSLVQFEKAGSLTNQEYIALQARINRLEGGVGQELFLNRLDVVADVTGVVDKTDPRFPREAVESKSDGLGVAMKKNEISNLIDAQPGSLEAMQKMLRFMGFDVGTRKPVSIDYTLGDMEAGSVAGVTADPDLRRLFGTRWGDVKRMKIYELKLSEVDDMRKVMRYWVGRGRGLSYEETVKAMESDSSVEDAASVVESLIKHSRLLLQFIRNDVHPWIGKAEGFGVFQPGRRSGLKREKGSAGVHREYFDRYSGMAFDQPGSPIDMDPALGGLFIPDMAVSYWLDPSALKGLAGTPRLTGTENLADLILKGVLPRDDQVQFLTVYVGANAWIGGAKAIEKYYVKAEPLEGIGERGFAGKFVTEMQTILKSLGHTAGEPAKVAAFPDKKDAIVKSVLLARIGVEYDTSLPDGMRIKMDKDTMWEIIAQLNTQKFVYGTQSSQNAPVVGDGLRDWLLSHSRDLVVAERRERYARLSETPLGRANFYQRVYGRWITAVERGARDEEARMRKLASYRETYIEYVHPSTRTDRSIPHTSRLLLLSRPRSGKAENELVQKPPELNMNLGWMTDEGDFKKTLTDTFQVSIDAGVYSVNSNAELRAALKLFLPTYLVGRIGFKADSERLALTDDQFDELLTVLKNFQTTVRYGSNGTAYEYRGTLIENGDTLENVLTSRMEFSPLGPEIEKRKWRREGGKFEQRYREAVLAKAQGDKNAMDGAISLVTKGFEEWFKGKQVGPFGQKGTAKSPVEGLAGR